MQTDLAVLNRCVHCVWSTADLGQHAEVPNACMSRVVLGADERTTRIHG